MNEAVAGAATVEVSDERQLGAARRAAERCAFVGVLGLVVAGLYWVTGYAAPSWRNAFPYYFVRWEPLACLVLVAFGLWAARSSGHAGQAGTNDPLGRMAAWVDARLTAARLRLGVAAIAAGVAAVTLGATYAVAHDALLVVDEFSNAFQARIFAAGRLRAPLPDAWREFIPAVLPIQVGYRPADGTWASLYLPGYSAVRAGFLTLGWESLTNPAITGVTVALLAAVGARLWPGRPTAQWMAVALFAANPQVLANAATAFSMPLDLALNVAWLWLYLRGGRSEAALGPLGAAALGVHNPFPHAVFVAPFLLRMLRERRVGLLAYLAVWYGGASVLWYLWLREAVAGGSVAAGVNEGSLLSVFRLPGGPQVVTFLASTVLAAAWHTPVVTLGAAAALAGWRQLPPVHRDLAAGVGLNSALYLCMIYDQGHGWGYRYYHSVLGSVVLLAVAGLVALGGGAGRARVARWTLASLLVTVVLQLPYRAVQVDHETRPYADAHRFIASRDAAVVTVPVGRLWYDKDFLRNDPFLSRGPVVVGAPFLTPRQTDDLRARFGARFRPVDAEELRALGVPPLAAPRR